MGDDHTPREGRAAGRAAWIVLPSGRALDSKVLAQDAEMLALLRPEGAGAELALGVHVEVGELVEGIPWIAPGHVVAAPRGIEVRGAVWIALETPLERRQRRSEFRVCEDLDGRLRDASRHARAGTRCRVVDLSAAGACLVGELSVADGDEVRVSIALPEGPEVEALARVVRVRALEGRAETEVGVRFQALDGKAETLLRRHVARRQRERRARPCS